MSTMTMQTELAQIIKDKKLVDLNLPQDDEVLGYVLRANDDYITLAEISASFSLLAVSTYRLADVKTINLDSIYLREFAQQVPDDTLYQRAAESIKDMPDSGFEAFLQAFAHTPTLVEITIEDGDSFQGRIVDFNDDSIFVDEYYLRYQQRYARVIINRQLVTSMAVNTARTRVLAPMLAAHEL